ncbi:MAG: hypothetical protein HYZ28_00250 [Myxococcales bacterium]|nr:hypothetical protein [Myxococcales bacterium]
MLLSAGATSQELPPGHPPLDAPATLAPPLPSGHPPVSQSTAAPSIEELIRKLDAQGDLKTKEKTFEIAAAMGKLYYSTGRFGEAVEYLGQAEAKAEPTRKLYLEARKKAAKAKKEIPTASSAGCAPNKDASLESLHTAAEARAKSGDPAAAAACARAALAPLTEVELTLAHAKFIVGDAPGALAAHERQLEVNEASPDALFGRAIVLLDSRGEDVNALEQARAGFERYVRDYPSSPRAEQAKALAARAGEAIAAGGISKLAGRKPTPPPPPGPEMSKLVEEAEELLSKGRFQEALEKYKQVMPILPTSGRATAGMAWSLIALDRKPMSERVWAVAIETDPSAVERLGDTLKAKGDEKGAKAVWQRLLSSAPDYSGKAKLAEKLR